MGQSSTILSRLRALPGVRAAGRFSYRGDRCQHVGQLDGEAARLAACLCRATSLATHMESDILNLFSRSGGLAPAAGWIVRGSNLYVCVYGNLFCFVDSASGSLQAVLQGLREAHEPRPELV